EVGRINGDYGRVGVPAVHYLHQSYSRSELAALYCVADVMLVTPLRDGMNLVAKEYVAARADLGGALVLSEFAGAARELRQAYMCNPHDIHSITDALMRAVEADRTETAKRMHAMRRYLRDHGVRQWASDFLNALGTTVRTEGTRNDGGPDAQRGPGRRPAPRGGARRATPPVADRVRLRRHAGPAGRRSRPRGAAARGDVGDPVAGRAPAD